jgi:HEPN domain-containing protein
MSGPPDAPTSGSARDWLRHAASDLHLARIALPDPDVLRNQIAFHAQQTAEKALKAVLVARDVRFPRTHDLEALIEIVQLAGVPWPFAPAKIGALSPFAVETRYPSGLAQITDAEAIEAVEIAATVLRWASQVVA